MKLTTTQIRALAEEVQIRIREKKVKELKESLQEIIKSAEFIALQKKHADVRKQMEALEQSKKALEEKHPGITFEANANYRDSASAHIYDHTIATADQYTIERKITLMQLKTQDIDVEQLIQKLVNESVD